MAGHKVRERRWNEWNKWIQWMHEKHTDELKTDKRLVESCQKYFKSFVTNGSWFERSVSNTFHSHRSKFWCEINDISVAWPYQAHRVDSTLLNGKIERVTKRRIARWWVTRCAQGGGRWSRGIIKYMLVVALVLAKFFVTIIHIIAGDSAAVAIAAACSVLLIITLTIDWHLYCITFGCTWWTHWYTGWRVFTGARAFDTSIRNVDGRRSSQIVTIDDHD